MELFYSFYFGMMISCKKKKKILRRTFFTLSRKSYELKLKNNRSSRSFMFFKIDGTLKNFANFKEKHLCGVTF